MKTSFIIILVGLSLFVLGLSILAYEIFGNTEFRLNVETEVLILFGLVCSGLIISGVGLMLEFTREKYLKK